MCLGVFIAQLDSQVVNLALTQIGSDLNAGISQLQWVMDSYNLFYATLLLTGGTLGDLYGRMRVFATGIGLIVLGSIVCAVAPNGAVLIAGRALTGVGAALEVPTSLAILTVTYADAKERARLLHEAEKVLIAEDAPIAPIYIYNGFGFWDPKKISGLYLNIRDEHPVHAIRRLAPRTNR